MYNAVRFKNNNCMTHYMDYGRHNLELIHKET